MSGLTDAIVLGAGTGTRFSQSQLQKNNLPKQFELLDGKPIFILAIESLLGEFPIRQLGLVVNEEHVGLSQQLIEKFSLQHSHKIQLITGGERRQDSSFLGLLALEHNFPPPEFVIVHDACRPILSRSLVDRIKNAMKEPAASGWIPALPITDTLKRVEGNQVIETIERSAFVKVQTPQVFRFRTLVDCFRRLEKQPARVFTDDAAILEYFNETVHTVLGDDKNIKVTYASDLQLAHSYLLLNERSMPCELASDTISIV